MRFGRFLHIMGESVYILGPLVLLAVLLGFGVSRFGLLRDFRGGCRKDRKLRIEETKAVGGRQYLLVVEYEGRRFLIGSCVGRLEYLCALVEADWEVASQFRSSQSEPPDVI